MAPGSFSALLEALARPPDGASASPASDRWPGPGTVIGRFVLTRELGRGGFGVVYEARDEELRRSVAFKLVRPGRPDAGEEQLRREAEVIAQLSHPNLVTLHDLGRCEYGPYLVLELLRGATLEEKLAGGPLPPAEAVRLAGHVARGLAHAHAHGVVHRDLKPSNVFVCDDGQVKLLDFGMSHAFGHRRLDGGTPAYMAPEQWRGAPEDERTDVFALGVLLFRMLAGELPFPAGDGGKALRAGRAALRLEVPGAPALAELVARMLEQDPTRRPRDAAEVLATLEATRPGAAAVPLAGPVRARRRPPWRALAIAAALLLAAAVAALGLWRQRQAGARPPAIAVLPFEDRSEARGDPGGEGAGAAYLGDGLTEELLNLLTRVRALRVAASASTFSLKGKDLAVEEVARRLGVDLVLGGTVRQEPGRLRVSAELVDGRTGFRLWSQIYERPPEDLFAVQAEIVRQVASASAVKLGAGADDALRRLQPGSPAAYDRYLRARAALRLPRSEATLDRAAGLFQQAVALDPGYAPAHAGLCDTWLARYELRRATEAFGQAERACQAARERDPEAGEVLLALGRLHLTSGRYPEAEREFQEAAALTDNPAEATLGLARTYAAQQRPELADRTFREARRLDPGDWGVPLEQGVFLAGAGRFEEAARAFGEAVALSPDNVSARNNLGVAHFMAGHFAEAVAAWKEALALGPWHGAYANLGTSYFYLGRYAEAAEMYRKAIELTPDECRLWGNLGDAYAALPARAAEAREAFQRASALAGAQLRVNPSDAETASYQAAYEAALGHRDQAHTLADDARRRDASNLQVRFNAALTHARLGEPAAALEELERAVALGYQRRLLSLDPGLAPLRGERRFQALADAPDR